MSSKCILLARLVASLGLGVCIAQEAKPSDVTPGTQKSPVITNESLPTGARIYIAPMPNGFDTLVAGLEKKKVPVTVVTDREKADYELSGVSDTDKAGWAKMLFMGSQQTNETASIKITNLKTGDIVFAYSVNKTKLVEGQTKRGRVCRQTHQREGRKSLSLRYDAVKTAFITLSTVLIVLVGFSTAAGQAPPSKVIPSHAKVFVAAMPDGFDQFLKDAIEMKKVPVEIVAENDKADFVMTGVSETQKASTAKKVLMWDWRSNEQASIQVASVQSGEVVLANSVNKISSAHSKKSSAEACAKHLKEKIESQK
jgi:hypothetical protein